MNKKQLVLGVLDCIKKDVGDFGRNQYILKRLNENKIIFDSDKKYLERLMKIKIDSIEDNYDQIRLNKIKQKSKTVFLNPKLVKCNKCKTEIKLDEKSTRQKNEWYHSNCFAIKPKTQNDYDKASHDEIQKYKLDGYKL